MNRKQLIKKYIDFFKKKGHKEAPNSSLIRENDPTVLFTTAGMHPLVPYLTGQKHPLGKRLVSVQRCIRTGDIEEVGDEIHLTFFEMLGNWSLGDYWKKDAIEYSYEFLTKDLKIDPKELSVTCFKGDKNAPKDDEAANIWKSLKINKIKFLDKKENWWGPAGESGPCGPDSEMFVNNIEIWNDVFMQYDKTSKGYEPLKQKNVDTGMGVERTIAILQGKKDIYETEIFQPIIKEIEKISNRKYGQGRGVTKNMRIIADHIKAAVFILAEGIIPGNTEQSYVLRRLIRRAVRYGRQIGINDFSKEIAKPVFEIYDDYPELKKNKKQILENLEKEEKQFEKTLEKGLKQFEKMTKDKFLDGKETFLLYQSYGFPIEIVEELAKEKKIKIDLKGFEKEQKKHITVSGAAVVKGKFKAGLADQSATTAKLHTATHLLHQALRNILGDHVKQMGSNITPERLRFDFSHPQKLTEEEKKKVEDLVNKEISKGIDITFKEMPYKEAIKTGALSFFRERYPEIVKVYSVGNFSKEICAGPHVKNTKELGKFKIKKESSSAAGVRRIKAVVG